MTKRSEKRTKRLAVGVSILVFAVAISVGVASSALGSSSRHSGKTAIPLPSGAVLDQLKTLSFKIAAEYGEGAPTGGQVTVSTRQPANEVTNGAEIADTTPVYVVSLQGHFTSPRGGPFGVAPQGSVMTLVIDSTTFNPLDLTLSKMAPNLAQLGPVEPLG
jgi:hypothetical protein